MGLGNLHKLKELVTPREHQPSSTGTGGEDQLKEEDNSQLDLLRRVPPETYCQLCERTQTVFTLTQILHQVPNRFLSCRTHLVLECSHPPASPYDRWEECVTISCEPPVRPTARTAESIHNCPRAKH